MFVRFHNFEVSNDDGASFTIVMHHIRFNNELRTLGLMNMVASGAKLTPAWTAHQFPTILDSPSNSDGSTYRSAAGSAGGT